MIFLEVGNIGSLIALIIFIFFGIPIILFFVGLSILKKHPKAGKLLMIISGLFLIISLGVCGSMMK